MFGQVTTVCVSVAAESASEGFIIRVCASMRRQGGFHGKRLFAAGVIAHERFGTGVSGHVIGELLMCDAAVAADAAGKGFEVGVVLHVAV